MKGPRQLHGVAQMPPFYCPCHARPLTQFADRYGCPEGEIFPVRDGIARFVRHNNYADAFGRQWNRFRLTQLDSHTGLRLSEERALRCLGLGSRSGDFAPLLSGQTVLEVGCGAGRFTEILLKHGALVTSVDLSSAVDANARTFPPSRVHRIAQADVRGLPFAARQFDGVFCLGVVQHTPNPKGTIAALYEQVRPGGWLALDHYAIDASTLTWVGAHLARQVFKRLPAERKLSAIERMVDLVLPLHRAAVRRGPLPARMLSRVSPVVTYYHRYAELSPGLQREWAVLDTHDALTDTFKHHRTVAQLRSYLVELGLEDLVVARAGNGVEARGRRPLTEEG